MIRQIKLVSLCIISVCLATSVVNARTRMTTIENAKKFTVLVTQEGLLGSGRGSGILLDERHVLTCFHMLRTPKDELFVYTYPFGAVYKARVDTVDQTNDLAYLILDSSAVVHVQPVFQPKTQDGETITVIGNALGSMKWLVASGVISGRERDYLLTDASVQHGDSGGPWINEKGEIVALSDWGLEGIPGIAGGISGAVLARSVDTYQHPDKAIRKFLELLLGGGKR